MNIDTDIWKLYTEGKNYNTQLGIYDTVKRNDRFVSGDQWEGINVKDLPKPQFNIFKRVINHFVAYLISSPIKMLYTSNNETIEQPVIDKNGQIVIDKQGQVVTEEINRIKPLNDVANQLWEDNKMDDNIKTILKKGAISGDMCFYCFWDSEIDAGNGIKGDIVVEVIDGINVIFGNPNKKIINQRGKAYQPYILIVGRDMVEKLREEAKRNGFSTEGIVSDLENEYGAGNLDTIEMEGVEAKKATYVIKMWYDKETGTVHHSKTTQSAYIYEDKDTLIPVYPLSWENWETKEGCYHGEALVTNYISNQKFINKQWALAMVHEMLLAMPTKIYDKTRIQKWTNQVGSAIGVNGAVNGVVDTIQGSPVSPTVIETIKMAMTETLESMGANDVLLGNIKPDNAKAIITVVQQASTTLLNQKTALYNIVEQLAEIWWYFIKAYYGDVTRKLSNNDGQFDFNASEYANDLVKPKIEVGESKWWSETASVMTLDGLLQAQIINARQYLKRLPDGYIPNKDELISELEEQQQMAEQMQMLQQKNAELKGLVGQIQQEADTQIKELGYKKDAEIEQVKQLATRPTIEQELGGLGL